MTSELQRFTSVRHVQHIEGVLGTSLELRLEATKQTQAKAAQNALLEEISRLEKILNRFLPDSELNPFLATFHEPFAISKELEYVLLCALEWQRRSGGAFHIGAEALWRIWKTATTTPTAANLAPTLSALRLPLLDLGIGYALHLSDLPINLNAIAKGYIADCAARKAQQYSSEVLVNLGGDLVHRGHKPVRASIANPYSSADNAPPLERIWLCNQGLATSGHTHRGRWLEGKWISHLLNPHTGQPVQDVLSASVLAPDAMTADVLATVCSVLSPQQSFELLHDQPQVGVCIVSKESRHCNSFWKEHRIGK